MEMYLLTAEERMLVELLKNQPRAEQDRSKRLT